MFKHAIFEGFKYIIRSFWLSATAISVLTVSLGSVALMSTFSTIVGYSVRQLDNQIAIVAYFKENIDTKTIEATKKDLETIPEVKETRYVNRTQAQKRLQEGSTVADNLIKSLQKSNISFALEYLEVVPKSSEDYAKVEATVRGEKYKDVFAEIQAVPNLIENLQKIYYWIRIIGVALVIIFGSISILVMINILRIAVYSFKDEIEIMRLVGATNNYIRAPFIMEGIYFNVIAALVVISIFIPSLSILLPKIQSWIGASVVASSAALLNQIYFSLGLTILVGIVIGAGTTYVAIHRYLKL